MTTDNGGLKFAHQNTIIAAGVKVIELCKVSFRISKCKRENAGLISYIQDSIEEGNTVLDIGSKHGDYIYFMRRKLKESGKIIAFESQPYLYQRLFYLAKIMKWKNVKPELIKLSNISGTFPIYDAGNTRLSHSAIVIRMNENLRRYVSANIAVHTLDNYCSSQNIRPGFLKIDADGNELKILKGAINTLKNFKPRILLKCEERIAGAEKVLQTFSLLEQLGYAGYFVLDTIRIPLVNFDFNVYQNPCRNFYCCNFMFE